jgi:two-component system sensor histidine kinase/response regulator
VHERRVRRQEVEQAADGAGAIARLATATAKGEDYDLLLLDWLMPDMSGGEVIEALQAKGLALPARTIVVSAADSAVLRQEAVHPGVSDVIQKPLLPSVLRRICAAELAESGGSFAEHGGESSGSLQGLSVLLVEDNEVNQQVAGEILRSWGARVDVAANGQIALDLLYSHAADYYAAVLMDLEMPVMDGREATRRLRDDERFHDLPVIVMVGMSDFTTVPKGTVTAIVPLVLSMSVTLPVAAGVVKSKAVMSLSTDLLPLAELMGA